MCTNQAVDAVSNCSDGNDILPNYLGKPIQAVVKNKYAQQNWENYFICSTRWNPLSNKSGLMGVLHAQTKKNRVVSKHGRVNTVKKSDEVQEHHRFPIILDPKSIKIFLC